MAIAGEIKVGNQISHFGTFRSVIGVATVDRMTVLSIQEDGAVGTRTEIPKANIPLFGE